MFCWLTFRNTNNQKTVCCTFILFSPFSSVPFYLARPPRSSNLPELDFSKISSVTLSYNFFFEESHFTSQHCLLQGSQSGGNNAMGFEEENGNKRNQALHATSSDFIFDACMYKLIRFSFYSIQTECNEQGFHFSVAVFMQILEIFVEAIDWDTFSE